MLSIKRLTLMKISLVKGERAYLFQYLQERCTLFVHLLNRIVAEFWLIEAVYCEWFREYDTYSHAGKICNIVTDTNRGPGVLLTDNISWDCNCILQMSKSWLTATLCWKILMAIHEACVASFSTCNIEETGIFFKYRKRASLIYVGWKFKRNIKKEKGRLKERQKNEWNDFEAPKKTSFINVYRSYI